MILLRKIIFFVFYTSTATTDKSTLGEHFGWRYQNGSGSYCLSKAILLSPAVSKQTTEHQTSPDSQVTNYVKVFGGVGSKLFCLQNICTATERCDPFFKRGLTKPHPHSNPFSLSPSPQNRSRRCRRYRGRGCGHGEGKIRDGRLENEPHFLGSHGAGECRWNKPACLPF